MSVIYQQLLHNTALRLNALVGAQFGPLETTYITGVLTAANFKSADWPFTSFQHAILMAEEQFAWAIANTPSHPWRAYLDSQTASLANGVALPKVDTSSKPIIGLFGGVVDTGDGKPCEAQPLEVVRRAVQETWRVISLYIWATDGNRIYHSRPSVRVNCCIYDRAAQATAFAANAAMLLPDVLEPAITALAVSLMVRENANISGAAIYAEYAAAALKMIVTGTVGLPTTPLPSPIAASTAG